MELLGKVLLINSFLFSYILADTQNANVNGNNNLVTQIMNKGLSSKKVNILIRPYKDRVTSLERKLRRTVSMEEKYRLGEQLKKAREKLIKKNKEIIELNEFIVNSNLKVVKIASKIYEEEGLTATLRYFNSNEFNVFEKGTQKNIKELAGAYILKARLLTLENEYDQAKEAYKKALKYNRNSFNLFNYAWFLRSQNFSDELIPIYEELILMKRTSLKEYSTSYASNIAFLLNELAINYRSEHQIQRAEKLFIEALEIRRTLAENNSKVSHANVADTLNNLAILYMMNGQMNKAKKIFDEALTIRRNLAKNNLWLYDLYVATSLNSLGRFYQKNNQWEKGVEAYIEALKIRKSLVIKFPNRNHHKEDLANNYHNLAKLYYDNNQYKKSKDAYINGLKIYRELAKNDFKYARSNIAIGLYNLALLYKENGQIQEAKDLYPEIFKINRALFKNGQRVYGIELANSLIGYYKLNKNIKDLNEAEAILRSFNKSASVKMLLEKIQDLHKNNSIEDFDEEEIF